MPSARIYHRDNLIMEKIISYTVLSSLYKSAPVQLKYEIGRIIRVPVFVAPPDDGTKNETSGF